MDSLTCHPKSKLFQRVLETLKKRPVTYGLTLALSGSLTPAALANVTGSDTQNFNPTMSKPDFTTVHSSQTLPTGRFNFGFFLNQAT